MYTELYSTCGTELGVPLNLGRCYRQSLEFPKEVNPLVVFDEEQGMALEPIQGIRASSRVNFGYTELFRVSAGTSGSL